MELLERKNIEEKEVKISRILVFRSTIDNDLKADLVCRQLMEWNGIYKANVDLEDWEHILRIECGSKIRAGHIEKEVYRLGFWCSELED